MSIGYNIERSVVKNWPRLLAHVNQTRPNWCLTYGADSAIELRSAGVRNVTVRLYPDGGMNEKLTPDDWMRKFENTRRNGLYCEFSNECGLQTRVLLELLPKAIPRGFKMTLPGIATGQPEPTDWGAYNEVLDYLTTYPAQLVLSTHDYFAGYPQLLMAGYDTVEECRQWTPELGVPEQSWWLAGRTVCFLSKHQKARGKPMPRMIITELGEGNTGFLKGSVIPTPPYPPSFGYQSMYNEWAAAYPGHHPAEIYARMLIWLDRMIYVPGGVEGVCVYCWGADWNRPPGSEQDWKPFDLELYPEIFIREFEAYAMSVNQPPISPPTPAIVWEKRQLTTIGAVRFRAAPSTSAAVYQALEGTLAVMYDEKGDTTSDALLWKHIQYGGKSGYVAAKFISLTVPEPPPLVSAEDLVDWQSVMQAAQTIISIGSKHQ